MRNINTISKQTGSVLPPSDPGRKGVLLAFEGIDGGGKSTQAKRLAELLTEQGRDVVLSREPTNGEYGARLHASMTAEKRLSPQEELELFFLDRREHVERLIAPGLRRGAVVILDRYYYSSMAYQGVRGWKTPWEIHAMMTAIAPVPDLTFLFEIEIATALNRISRSRGEVPNLMEKHENLQKVKAVFDRMEFPEIIRINAERSTDEVFREVSGIVASLLEKVE